MEFPPYIVVDRAESALAALRSLGPDARLIAGGTAAQLEWPLGGPTWPIVDIGGMACGPVARIEAGRLVLAATARLEQLRTDPLVARECPVLGRAIFDVAALGVRYLGTIGGNLLWGAGDLVPLLLVCGAELRGVAHGLRPLATWLAKPAVDVAIRIEIPLPIPADLVFEKAGRRAAFSPSRITVARAVSPAGWTIAIGGGPVAPQLRSGTGKQPDFAGLGFSAPDDEIATGAHRLDIAARLLRFHRSAAAA